ncbi:MAG: septal ring lytic transglycosylase RlpA family protein [Betaproteobacteria bacterium]|nr:septal ring lytic transglycosylase RlpA family protein [Betaproteobacteria bacterium]
MRRALALLAPALVVAACGTAPKAPPKGEPKKPAYYSDDGPPDSVPADIALIPDAVPTAEPYHRYANRPYTVFGRSYAPVVNDEPMRERGLASWYGRKFHGQKTSSGEVYDMFAMTAAHKTLPIPSFARVTNLKSGASVVVRVNDRGPFHEGRVIDLSYAAAAKLGIAGPGSGPVEVERVFARDAGTIVAAGPRPPAAAPRPASPPASPPAPPATAAASASVTTPLRTEPPVPRPAEIETPLVAPASGGFILQLGAFSSVDNAESFRAHVSRELSWILEPIQVASAGGLHRVRLGPYKTREEAQAIADKIRASLDFAPVISPAQNAPPR